MGDDAALDRDARIKLSIGTKEEGEADGVFYNPLGLVFDHRRGLLLVADSWNNRVQVFSCDDSGSFVSKFGEEGDQPGQFKNPGGLAIDHDHDRILIVDHLNNRVQSWSLSEQSFLSCIGKYGSGDLEFQCPQGIAVDNHHLLRFLIADTKNHRLVFLSSIDFSFLFEFGEEGKQSGQFTLPIGVCIVNQGRIIVADFRNYRLQSFTHEGHHISSLDCGTEKPSAVAFDEHRGLIAFTARHRVHVIGANQWLADTFAWRPDRHRYAPSLLKRAISTMTMIRSLVDESSAMSMIPNELLFEIFSHL